MPRSQPLLVAVVRIGFALLGVSALVTEVAVLVERGRFDFGNFVSFYTVESNALSVVSLLLAAYAGAAGVSSRALDFFRGLVASLMATVILIFIALLSGYDDSELTAVPWDNTVLHYVMPIVLVLDWVLVGPSQPVPVRRAMLWLLAPLAYLAYSLVRGPIADWYPYPFMNPDLHGYGGVAVTSVVIAVVLAVVVAVVASVSRWLPTGRTGRDTSPAR